MLWKSSKTASASRQTCFQTGLLIHPFAKLHLLCKLVRILRFLETKSIGKTKLIKSRGYSQLERTSVLYLFHRNNTSLELIPLLSTNSWSKLHLFSVSARKRNRKREKSKKTNKLFKKKYFKFGYYDTRTILLHLLDMLRPHCMKVTSWTSHEKQENQDSYPLPSWKLLTIYVILQKKKECN